MMHYADWPGCNKIIEKNLCEQIYKFIYSKPLGECSFSAVFQETLVTLFGPDLVFYGKRINIREIAWINLLTLMESIF